LYFLRIFKFIQIYEILNENQKIALGRHFSPMTDSVGLAQQHRGPADVAQALGAVTAPWPRVRRRGRRDVV
jgi:hypothetical protein